MLRSDSYHSSFVSGRYGAQMLAQRQAVLSELLSDFPQCTKHVFQTETHSHPTSQISRNQEVS